MDARTGVNEELAIGPYTVTNQLDCNTGSAKIGYDIRLSAVNAGFVCLTINTLLKVAITAH